MKTKQRIIEIMRKAKERLEDGLITIEEYNKIVKKTRKLLTLIKSKGLD